MPSPKPASPATIALIDQMLADARQKFADLAAVRDSFNDADPAVATLRLSDLIAKEILARAAQLQLTPDEVLGHTVRYLSMLIAMAVVDSNHEHPPGHQF